MIRVRCISRSVNGMTEVAIPHLFLGVFADGEERDIDEQTAEALLKSPCFEEVKSTPTFAIKQQPAEAAQPDGGNL